MSARILRMRTTLKSALLDVGCPGNWDHITNQIGMFSFTGLNRVQCENMTKKWHVYMTMVSALDRVCNGSLLITLFLLCLPQLVRADEEWGKSF